MKWTVKQRYLAVLLLTLAVPACGGDNGTTDVDDVLAEFDGTEVSGAIESLAEPLEATEDATAAIASFLVSVDGVEFAPASVTDRIAGHKARDLGFALGVRPLVAFSEDVAGKTFVYDPGTGEWVEDAERTGAPSNGVRAIYTDDVGSELGYVDFTDEDTGTASRLGILIVQTTGSSPLTLADWIQSYDESETSSSYSSEFSAVGFTGDGTNQIDFDVMESATGDFDGNEAFEFSLEFDGDAGSYAWTGSGAYDAGTDVEEIAQAITVTQNGDATVLEIDGEDDFGSGVLKHKGVTIANIDFDDDDIIFTKPGGGSFSAEQTAELEAVVFQMVFTGLFLLVSMPFFFL